MNEAIKWKTLLERVVDSTVSVEEHLNNIQMAKRILFIDNNKKTIEDIIFRRQNKEFDGINKLEFIRTIREDYGLNLQEALAVCEIIRDQVK